MPRFFDPANQPRRAATQVTIYGNIIVLTGTSGTANVSINGILNTAIMTFATTLSLTGTNWVAANWDYYFARGFVLTESAGIITIFPRRAWDTVNRINATITNATADLAGTLTGTFEPDLSKAKTWQVTFGQPINIMRPRGLVEGDKIRLELRATGAYTTTFIPAAVDVVTVTLTGTSGTANVIGGTLTKLATWNTSLTQTATDFVTSWAAAYKLVGITLTSSTADLIFTGMILGVPIPGPFTVTNVTTNLSGTIVHTTPNKLLFPAYFFPGGTENVQTSTSLDTVTGTVNVSMFPREDQLTLTGATSGTANITAGGLTKLATFNTNLTTTGSDFVTANAAAYAGVGLTLTSASGVLNFKAATPAAAYYPQLVVTTVTGTLSGINVNVPAGRVVIDAAAKDIKQ